MTNSQANQGLIWHQTLQQSLAGPLPAPKIEAIFPESFKRKKLSFREKLMKRLLTFAPIGNLTVELPGGHQLRHRGTGELEATIRVRKSKGLRRLITGGDLGFARAYMEGEVDIDNLTDLFHWFLLNEVHLEKLLRGNAFTRFLSRLKHKSRANSKKGSRKNIAYHYDLGNDFYQQWLDETMTYSSALFGQDLSAPLNTAQKAKYQAIADYLALAPTDDVLEIGCGWGGFADHILSKEATKQAETPFRPKSYTGITLSKEQLAYSNDRLSAHADSAAHFLDYRDIDQQYDKVASIEMFEAVGEEHWPTYFSTLAKAMKKDGAAAIQVITIEDDLFENYSSGADFIQTYIFPGGMLPSPERFTLEAEKAGLIVSNSQFFGASYAETLRRWRDTFQKHWVDLQKLGFDERFRRMWLYYLGYCEAGFDSGRINVGIFQLKHK